jgi:diguanylate cyclase (GGDEF)-like protein
MSQQAEVAAPPLRLLLVEDEDRTAFLLKELLEGLDDLPIIVHRVTTIAEASIFIDEGQADLVVLDLGLPDASELEGLERLQSCVAELPIIVLTGRNDERLALQALQRGAEDYLVKGQAGREMIVRSIRYAVQRHHVVRDLARVSRELQQANTKLERLTLLDPLTDLLNRRGLQQALTREISNLQRTGIEVVVMLVDIDDFKRVNETFGHAVGDVALMEVARKLKASIRETDYLGRLGGDEFLLLLPRTNEREVVHVAERTRVAIATTAIHHNTGTLNLTASIGTMMLSPDTPSLDEVVAHAHQLLRRSKREGKNRVTYSQSEWNEMQARARAQADMCANLASGRFIQTVKQPIYRLDNQSAVAYEFLSRYSDGMQEAPDNFFRICAERNILTLVDHHCLRRAVQASTEIPAPVRYHMNVFPTTMISIPGDHLLADFPSPLPKMTYCLEISEQQIIGEPSHLLGPVRILRDAGLLIAIDDVGFGNSCLESLVLLEPDIVKIDKRCVTGLCGDRDRIRHLERFVTLSRVLGADVIVEGVETEADLAIVRDLGVPYAQGFYWGRPA